jgi:gliding motility-associated-like protein
MFAFRTRPVLYLLLFLLSFNFSFANHRYVNINNPTPGLGTSWATAFTDLNAAAATLSIFDTIWVAQGTYKPTGVGRAATFLFQSGSVCGGFNGTETSFSQRDPKVNITILSGDIGIPGDASDNCYHVVTLHNFNGSSILDGFTIRDGNANAGYPGSTAMRPDNSGGGVLDLASTAGDISYTGIGHDIITNNFAVYGGGFCAYGDGQGNTTKTTLSFGLITTSQFDNNTAAVMGGAICILTMNQDWGTTDVFNCIFTNNKCPVALGTVMACYVNDPYTGAMHCSLDNCTLYNNGSPVIYNQQVTGVSNIEVTNDIVWKSGAAYLGPLIVSPANPISFSNSDVYLQTPLTGGGNIDLDPQFVNPAGNDFHVSACSPVVDAGYALFEVKKDIDGNVRPQGNGQDMGVYETAKPLPPTPPAADSTWCQFATANALTATPTPGNTLMWYTSSTGGSGSATAPIPSTTVATSVYYYVSQVDPLGCEGPRTLVKAIIKPGAAMPTAPNVTYCLNDVAVALTATPAAGNTLLWYTAATGGAGASAAPIPSTAATGTTTYYVTQTPAAGCESARKPIIVTVNGQPLAPTASPVNYCQNVTASALTATGSGLLWYTVATGGTGVTTAPTPSTTTIGTTTYYVSQKTGTCESPRTAIVVTVGGPPAAPTTSPVSYCQNSTASALTATGSGLLWYTAPTGGTGNTVAPTPSTTTVGTTTYYVSQSNGCESPRAAIVVTVGGPPAAPTTSPVSYCQNSTASALTATGSGLLWYTAATGGTGNTVAPTPSTTTVGTTTYYVSQSNGCESPRTALVVTVGTQSAAPTTAPATYCQNDAAVALTASGTNLLWYNTATGGTGAAVAPTPSTATAGIYSYYVTQTLAGGCESPRSVVTVTVNVNPAADFDWSPACAGSVSTISAVSTATAPDNYTWNFGTTASASGSGAGPYQVVYSSGGNYAVTLTATTGACQSKTTHNVTVYALPQVSISPVNGPLCAGGSVTLNATGASTYQWSPATGLSDATIGNPVAALKSDISYSVTGTDNNGCAATAQISLKPAVTCLGYNIPDAFTPNGDGHNDLFRVITADAPQSFRMMIFNRWGQKVFETRDVQAGWDGTIGGSQAMTGAYVYTIVIKTSAGTTIEKKGTVLLIR